jgi:hypothetical protein
MKMVNIAEIRKKLAVFNVGKLVPEKMAVFWVVASCILMKVYRRFEGASSLIHCALPP